MASRWDLYVVSQVSDFSMEKLVCFLPRFLSFLPWKACAYLSFPADSLPLAGSYLLPAAESCPNPPHSWVPTWAFPVPAVEKHPLLGQEHPALLECPARVGSRAGCECEERTMNSTIPMAWPPVKALRAPQHAPGEYTYTCIWIIVEIHSLIIPCLPWISVQSTL